MLVGPLHTAAQRAEVEGQVADAVKRGRVFWRAASDRRVTLSQRAHFYLPTLLVDVDEQSKVVTKRSLGRHCRSCA